MIVRTLDQVVGTEREVSAEGWTSRRLLLAADGMGFSLHDTIIEAGAELHMCYRHHLEAVYCISGRGTAVVKSSGEEHIIKTGTVYALDQHDEHVLRAQTAMRMVCVFNPPLEGTEVHGEDGAYPPPGDAPKK